MCEGKRKQEGGSGRDVRAVRCGGKGVGAAFKPATAWGTTHSPASENLKVCGLFASPKGSVACQVK